MKKSFYNYSTFWGLLGGGALAFIYLKTLGKDKNLNLMKTLLIGAGIGTGVGLFIDILPSKKDNQNAEGDNQLLTPDILRALAKELNDPVTETELETYLLAVDKGNLSQIDQQRVYRVIRGLLSAKKDNKWDENATMQVKKEILRNYKVTDQDFLVFQDIIVNKLSDLITNLINR